MSAREEVDRSLTKYIGIRLPVVLGIVIAAVLAGAIVGVAFPKFEASALLQFPEKPKDKDTDTKLTPNRPVELALFKRVAAAYCSTAQLHLYLEKAGLLDSVAARRLLAQSDRDAFWDRAAAAALPFSKRDQREYGEIKDAAGTALIGVELTADAPSPQTAAEMIGILGAYFTNAVVRERIRAWALAGKADSIGTGKQMRADIVRAELDMDLLARRALDMKEIIAKNPGAANMDARQVVSVNPTEGGDRFLSPLAQLVGLESAISQRRESVRRMEREMKQKDLQAGFFSDAEPLIENTVTIHNLIKSLSALADKSFASADRNQEWVKETTLRVYGALDEFSAMPSLFGIRNDARVSAVKMRDPVRLAVLGGVLTLLLFAAVALVRMNLPSRPAGN